MPHELNPNIETMFLLCNIPWQRSKIEVIQELDAMGVDGTALYNQNSAIIERYYAAFEEEWVASDGAALLSELDEALLVGIYMSIIWQHPEWVAGIGDASDEALAQAVHAQISSAVQGQEDLINGLERLGVSDQTKWQMMLLLQRPRQQLGAVFNAISENLPAYKNAFAEVAGDMGELWEEFDNLAENAYGKWPLDMSRVFDPSAPVIPMLALPYSVMLSDDAFFCGLLCYKLFQSVSGELSKEELIIGAKALSDKSKMEILLCLKDESLYGLEIAEKIGLTPATVSHHMGILLATGFVDLEKRDGKAYYRLSKTGIQKYLAGMSQLLL